MERQGCIAVKNLFLATYLKVKGIRLILTDLDDSGGLVLQFPDSTPTHVAISNYYIGRGMVDALSFVKNFEALRMTQENGEKRSCQCIGDS